MTRTRFLVPSGETTPVPTPSSMSKRSSGATLAGGAVRDTTKKIATAVMTVIAAAVIQARRSRPRDAAAATAGGNGILSRATCVVDLESRSRRVGDPMRGILGEAAAEQRADRPRRVARQTRPVGFAAHHRGEHIGDGLAGERAPAGKHLEQHASERPQVCTPVDRLAARLLGTHVRGGAQIMPCSVIAGLVTVGELSKTPAGVRAASASSAFARPKSRSLTVPPVAAPLS